jgi:hypothetical protein
MTQVAHHFSRVARKPPVFTLHSHRHRSLQLKPQFASLLSRDSAKLAVLNVTVTLTRFVTPLLLVTSLHVMLFFIERRRSPHVPFRVYRGSASLLGAVPEAPLRAAFAPRTPQPPSRERLACS